jgi:hypothetical protein
LSYAAAGGFTAFLKAGSANTQELWLRSPDGSQKRLSASVGAIEAVNSIGEVIFGDRGRRYFVSSTSPPVDVSSTLGQALFRCGRWYVIIGNAAFQIAGVGAEPTSGCDMPPPPSARDAGSDAVSDAGSTLPDASRADAMSDAGEGAGGTPGEKDPDGAGATGGSVSSDQRLAASNELRGCGCRLYRERRADTCPVPIVALLMFLGRRSRRRAPTPRFFGKDP